MNKFIRNIDVKYYFNENRQTNSVTNYDRNAIPSKWSMSLTDTTSIFILGCDFMRDINLLMASQGMR